MRQRELVSKEALLLIKIIAISMFVLSSIKLYAEEDTCRKHIPSSLQSAIEEYDSDFRLPRMSDTRKGALVFLSNNGTGCLTTGIADFDGNGHKDLAILLMEKKGDRTDLIAAMNMGESWKIEQINFSESDYINILPAGTYKRMDFGEEVPLGKNERKVLVSKHPGIMSGRTEASAVAFFRIDGMWLYTWQAD